MPGGIHTRRNISLLAEDLPGKLNWQADEESKTVKDRCDWMLNRSVFQQINAPMGPLEMDLFASQLTKQLPRFYNWRPDPKAKATRCLYAGLGSLSGIRQPSMVSNIPLSDQAEKISSTNGAHNTIVENSVVVPNIVLELLEEFPQRIPHQLDLVAMPQG